MERIQGGVCAPQGFLAAGVHCGILKNKQKKDLALIYSLSEANAAAVYTKNLVKGAPIEVTRENIAAISSLANAMPRRNDAMPHAFENVCNTMTLG